MDQATIVFFGVDDNPRHVITLNVPEGRADNAADLVHEILVNALQTQPVRDVAAS